MCLAMPMRITEREGEKGTVEAGGVRYEVSFQLLPGVAVGDFVIVHAGFAIQRLDTEDAEKTISLFKELDDDESGAPRP